MSRQRWPWVLALFVHAAATGPLWAMVGAEIALYRLGSWKTVGIVPWWAWFYVLLAWTVSLAGLVLLWERKDDEI